MANSLIPFDASEVRKSAQDILAEPELFDSELDYFELGESYSLRRFTRALGLTGDRMMWALVGLITVAFSISGGYAWASIWAGIVSGLVTLLATGGLYFLVNYLFVAPQKMDRELRENLRAAKKQLAEERFKAARAVGTIEAHYGAYFDQLRRLQEHKAIFLLDIYPGRNTVHVGSLEEEPDALAYNLDAKLQMSFMNRDVDSVLIEKMFLSIVTEAGDELRLSEEWPVQWESNSFQNTEFKGFHIPASHPASEDYWLRFMVDIPYDCAKSLDAKSFLRVSMVAARQDRYFVDLVINWKAAKRGDSSIISFRETAEKQ